eukprot:6455103-Amphidinium_carterae.1
MREVAAKAADKPGAVPAVRVTTCWISTGFAMGCLSNSLRISWDQPIASRAEPFEKWRHAL